MKEIQEFEYKKSLQLRAEKTFVDITQATDDLMQKDEGKLPTARELASKSGYSIGTFYRYFGTLNSLFAFIFIDRHLRRVAQESEEIIRQFSPHDEISTVINTIVDAAFKRLQKKKHTSKKYKLLMRLLLKVSKKPEELNRVIDSVIPALLQFARENVTNTCRIMSENECRLALRAFQAIMRSPFLEDDPIAGTAEHKKYACEFGVALFGKAKGQD